jgi:hypothetical protein
MIDMDGKHVLIQVKVEAFARNKAIQVTETCHEFPVLVRVTGAQWHHGKEMPRPCPGVDVVVALNVWKKEVQEAVKMLVDRLSPNDRLSILFLRRSGYERMELTYMSDHGRGVATLKISEIAQSHADDGASYLGPILENAAKVHPLTFP